MSVIVGAACQPLQPPGTGDPAAPPASPAIASDARLADGGDRAAAAPDAPLVALLVPLSGRQEPLGTAVRDGFIAASLEAPPGQRFNVMFIDEARVSGAEAHRQALEAGARAFVGPLLKETLQALAPLAQLAAESMPGQMPVLALNTLGDDEARVNGLWQFGLAPEDEARQVALRATALGQRRALVLVPASDWGQRLLAAFSAEFARGGGVIVDSRTYLPGTADYSQPIRSLLQTTEARPVPASPANPAESLAFGPGRRPDADLLFLASNSSNGRQLVPQLKFFGAADLPTYSTSAIWDDGSSEADDLNGVIFPDSPWVIAPDDRALAAKSGLVRHWGRQALAASRLYGLGYDARQLLPVVVQSTFPIPLDTGTFRGVTGVLYADPAGRIHRRLSFAQVRGGRAVPLPDATAPAITAIDP